MGALRLLSDEDIEQELAGLPGWERKGDEITRTYEIRYHAAVAAIVTIADRSRRIHHHADLDLRIDHLRASITTHDLRPPADRGGLRPGPADRRHRCRASGPSAGLSPIACSHVPHPR